MVMFTAVCSQNWYIEAENGDRQDCKKGERYTVSSPRKDGTVMVCSTFWVPAPASIFDLNTMRPL